MTTKTYVLRNGAALLLFLLICSQVTAQKPSDSCDFIMSLSLDTRFHFHSKNYVGPIKNGMTCRWRFICPEGLKCRMDCLDLQIPNDNCHGDRLIFSPTGDGNLADAKKVCANGTLEVKSVLNELVVGLQITPNSPGGKFDCTISSSTF